MRCKCGKETLRLAWAKVDAPYVFIMGRDPVDSYHSPRGCGEHLIWEGATCRGAAGKWMAWCEVCQTPPGVPHFYARINRGLTEPCDAWNLVFTEAES